MIEFVHAGIKVKCNPENALKYKQLMDKPLKTRTVPERRSYPQWNPTMTTEDYLRAYGSSRRVSYAKARDTNEGKVTHLLVA